MDPCLSHLPFDAATLQALELDSRGGDGVTMEPAMRLALDANFGSLERWREDFRAMGTASGDVPGCLLLVFLPDEGALVNRWMAKGADAWTDGVPVLAMGLHEPAHPSDPGAAADARVASFLGAVDWAGVYSRYQHAVHAASESIGAAPSEVAGAVLLDVRRAGVFDKAASMLPGARWRDPARVAPWAAELPAGCAVLVYCVYGHEVSRVTALRLRAAGLDARYLRGGIDGWQAAGWPVVDKPAGPSP